jgi:DNA recombination protein RmuC
MLNEIAAAVSGLAAVLIAILLVAVLRLGRDAQAARLLGEQVLAGQRAEAETTRAAAGAAVQRATAETADRLALVSERLVETRGELNTGIETVRTALSRDQGEVRLVLESKLGEMREAVTEKLAEIQRGVNEQLHAAVEKQMNESFARVVDQFTAVQKAMSDVAAVTAQIGDIKRLFSNVKTRGGWGEAQVRAMLDDILPEGAYETNVKLRAGSDEAVEFAVRMPGRGEDRPLLPIDAKFPVEDYERLLAASELGDAALERVAAAGLAATVKREARRIAEKYVNPPVTVEFAILYLPTDGLYAEIARSPGLIDEIGRACRVLVMGPSLFPALLRTIHLGFVTLALEQKAGEIGKLLSATRTEMVRMDDVLAKLSKQAGSVVETIDKARVRTRAVGRKLKALEVIDAVESERLLELEAEQLDAAE